ncbi:hypothetical protein LPJ66_011694, partial [Kickxella alabastrina]
GIQSLGATVAWQLDAKNVSYLNQLIGNWVLLVISLPPMFYVVYTLKDRSEHQQDFGKEEEEEGFGKVDMKGMKQQELE